MPFKPVAYDPYRKRRSRWQVPPWMVLLFTGIGLGVLGTAVVQEHYLPPRLSVSESASLKRAFETANADRTRLQAESASASQQLQAALADRKTMSDQLAAARADVAQANADVAAVIAALPPDPRGGAVEVRAGWIVAKGAALNYNLVLTRERAAGRVDAVLQMLATGDSAKGSEVTVTLKPVTVSLGATDVVRGNAALPDGFKPRQVSIQLYDRPGGKLLGLRVLLVK
jgi:hypothetical protein